MSVVMKIKTPAETGFEQNIQLLIEKNGHHKTSRQQAFERFQDSGLPHRRNEEWKYTDLRRLVHDAPPLARPGNSNHMPPVLQIDSCITLTFINGFYQDNSQELPHGLSLAREQAFETTNVAALNNHAYILNSALVQDSLVLKVSRAFNPDRPVQICFFNEGPTAFSSAVRLHIDVEAGASLTLIETHQGANAVSYQPNHVMLVNVQKNASMQHVRLNGEGNQAICLSTLVADLHDHACFDTFNMHLGGHVARHQVFVTFAGEGVQAGIRGSTMLSKGQHGDTTLYVDHAKPNGASRELFKTVIDDDATGVFQGKIVVRPHAQKTDGRMMSAALLLSENATMNNKPELEIFADDVQCAHGATCGELDDDLLFYIMARGIPRKQAEALLIESFLGESIEEGITDDALKDQFMELIHNWLQARK